MNTYQPQHPVTGEPLTSLLDLITPEERYAHAQTILEILSRDAGADPKAASS